MLYKVYSYYSGTSFTSITVVATAVDFSHFQLASKVDF